MSALQQQDKDELIGDPGMEDDNSGFNGITDPGTLGKVSDLDYTGRTITEEPGDEQGGISDGVLSHLAPGATNADNDDRDGGRLD